MGDQDEAEDEQRGQEVEKDGPLEDLIILLLIVINYQLLFLIYLEELEERHHHGAVVALNLPQAVVE